MSVRQEAGEADCAVCVCSAGLVCMKSSTSVVELVMLLCSQVGYLPLCLLSSVICHTRSFESHPQAHTQTDPICSYLGIRQDSDLHHETSSLSTINTLQMKHNMYF